MVSFNSWNGEKCHGNARLVTDLLKGELDFQGLVISDWDGIDYLDEDPSECVARGLETGIDLFMVSEHWREFIRYAEAHVRSGRISSARLDDAVRRILRVKAALGLFQKPRPAERPYAGRPLLGCEAHRVLAREAVRRSLVPLKNEGALLPLARTARVLVAGKNAHNLGHQCGGFTIAWQGSSGNDLVEGGTTIWEGIKALCPTSELDETGSSADPARHDVAVVVMGERPYAEGLGDIRSGDDVLIREGSQIKGKLKKLEPYGHSTTLATLHPEDGQVLSRIAGKGVPVVAVMLCGRPLVTEAELAQSAAFVVAWLPGSEGLGVAEALFGAQPEGEPWLPGRLPFSWPKEEGAPQWVEDEQINVRFPRGYAWPA
jgi:beta-glucosidase